MDCLDEKVHPETLILEMNMLKKMNVYRPCSNHVGVASILNMTLILLGG